MSLESLTPDWNTWMDLGSVMKFLSCVNVLVGYYVSNILLFSCTLTLVIVCTQACEATMETHTLARYFSEHSLQEYDFVMEKPSYVAAASMYLALRMKKLGGWVGQAWYNVVPFDLHPQFLSFSLSLSLSLSLPPYRLPLFNITVATQLKKCYPW